MLLLYSFALLGARKAPSRLTNGGSQQDNSPTREGTILMPQVETRRLAAIMFTDIVGFSHQMGANETRMLRLLEIHNHLLRQAVTEHQGHVIKTMGDAFVVDFPSVVNAVQCAQHVQGQFRAYNRDKDTPDQTHL